MGTRQKSDTQAGAPRARKPGFSHRRLNRRLCLVASGYVLATALCGLTVYLWQSPLPALAIPQIVDEGSASSAVAGRAGAKASLEICLRQVKIRDLFRPSIPVPSEGGIGSSTAQELADRLQFVGIMEGAGGLAALVFIPNRGPGTFHVGDRVAEFVLKDVQPDRLVLGLGDEEAILKR